MGDMTRRAVAFLIAIGVFAMDAWTKWLVETHLSIDDSRTVIPGFLNIVRSANTGASFSFLADAPAQWRVPLLIGLSIFALALLALMVSRVEKLDGPSAPGLALICGGAMGNLYDRVRVGSVTDFLDFFAGNHHWYTFNVADASICTGAGLLILSMLKAQRNHEVRVH
jgi:signal peptidase II